MTVALKRCLEALVSRRGCEDREWAAGAPTFLTHLRFFAHGVRES